MRKYISIVIILGIMIFSGSDCDQTDAPTNNTDCPDNNTFECATQITLGVPFQDNISSNDDVDIFQFTLPQDGITEVAVTNVPSNINLNVYLYNSEQSRIADNQNSGSGQNVYLIKGQKGGSGFVKVEDRDHNANSSSLYSINVTQDISDTYELNEDNPFAKSIQQNTNLEAKFRPNDDYDWYQFTTTQGGIIDINVWNIPNNINVHSRLYDNNVNAIMTADNNGLGQSVSMSISRKQGLHYLRLYDQDRDNNNSNYYNFSVFLDVSDIYEYNNELEDAKTISTNSNYQAKIKPKNDYDYFQFVLNSPGSINVSVTNVPSNINIALRLYNNGGGQIATSSNSGNGQPVNFAVNNLQSGVYYIRIWDFDQDQFNTQFYNFTISNF